MFWKILIGYILAVLYFTYVAIGAEIYERKGYSKSKGAYWCLIPGYGLYRVLKAPAIRDVPKGALRKYYKPSEILKIVIFAELVLVAISIILPVTL